MENLEIPAWGEKNDETTQKTPEPVPAEHREIVYQATPVRPECYAIERIPTVTDNEVPVAGEGGMSEYVVNVCMNCNLVFSSKEQPEICPSCGSNTFFKRRKRESRAKRYELIMTAGQANTLEREKNLLLQKEVESNKRRQEEKRIAVQSFKGEETCEILKLHRIIMCDDPNRLTTEFLKKIIRVDC